MRPTTSSLLTSGTRHGAVEVVLGEVLPLVVGQALVVERADDQGLAVLDRLPGGGVVGEVQDRCRARSRPRRPRRRWRGSAGSPPPATRCRSRCSPVAPRSRAAARSAMSAGASAAARSAPSSMSSSRNRAISLRLVEERSAVEHAGDELAHAREELDVAAPVALGVVVEVHQADELARRRPAAS